MKNEPPILLDDTRIAIFKKKEIRKVLHNGEWWFSVIDVVAALTESANARDYWYRMKTRVSDEEGTELSTICRQLKLMASDGKKYETDCADTEGTSESSSLFPHRRQSRSRGGFSLSFPRRRESRCHLPDTEENETI